MRDDSEVYIGLDTSKLKISVALAFAGRGGEVRFFDDIDTVGPSAFSVQGHGCVGLVHAASRTR
jgi:transposase